MRNRFGYDIYHLFPSGTSPRLRWIGWVTSAARRPHEEYIIIPCRGPPGHREIAHRLFYREDGVPDGISLLRETYMKLIYGNMGGIHEK